MHFHVNPSLLRAVPGNSAREYTDGHFRDRHDVGLLRIPVSRDQLSCQRRQPMTDARNSTPRGNPERPRTHGSRERAPKQTGGMNCGNHDRCDRHRISVRMLGFGRPFVFLHRRITGGTSILLGTTSAPGTNDTLTRQQHLSHKQKRGCTGEYV